MPVAAPVAPLSVAAAPAAVTPGSDNPLEPIAVKTVAVKPGSAPMSLVAPATTASVAPAKGPELAFADPVHDQRQPGVLGVLPMKVASAMPMHPVANTEIVPELLRSAAHRSGWMIQVGAFDKEEEAKSRLSSALTRAKALLGMANGFTERVAKGAKTLYRARFAGLDKEQAEAACEHLKKNEIACMALKN
jgi:D-alanyl-D-alanine carboxypeptidase